MPVNVKLLKKVRKLIAEEPRRLRMWTWGGKVEAIRRVRDEKIPNPPPCGTVACLAGHILLASTPKRKWHTLFTQGGFFRDEPTVPNRAAKLIGLEPGICPYPFGEVKWKVPEVLAWIDRQIDAASK